MYRVLETVGLESVQGKLLARSELLITPAGPEPEDWERWPVVRRRWQIDFYSIAEHHCRLSRDQQTQLQPTGKRKSHNNAGIVGKT